MTAFTSFGMNNAAATPVLFQFTPYTRGEKGKANYRSTNVQTQLNIAPSASVDVTPSSKGAPRHRVNLYLRIPLSEILNGRATPIGGEHGSVTANLNISIPDIASNDDVLTLLKWVSEACLTSTSPLRSVCVGRDAIV